MSQLLLQLMTQTFDIRLSIFKQFGILIPPKYFDNDNLTIGDVLRIDFNMKNKKGFPCPNCSFCERRNNWNWGCEFNGKLICNDCVKLMTNIQAQYSRVNGGIIYQTKNNILKCVAADFNNNKLVCLYSKKPVCDTNIIEVIKIMHLLRHNANMIYNFNSILKK